MGLLSGAVSVTRFSVTAQPDTPDFESARFVEIIPGSSVRERIGFLPSYQPGEPLLKKIVAEDAEIAKMMPKPAPQAK